MEFDLLSFLAEWWFVAPWYAFGGAAAIWVIWDTYTLNTHVGTALKWAWPIIVLFFSVLGLAAYLATSRPPGIGGKRGDEAMDAYRSYAHALPRRVTGSVIHCVGGDGIGIMTAMVFARIVGLTFWSEWWFEYVVGYLVGWFVFQYKAQLMHASSRLQAIWHGGRAEFFSMITVMTGWAL